MPVFSDNVDTIGRTPLVGINRLAQGLGVRLLAKVEGRNPASSVKCRIGAAMHAALRVAARPESDGETIVVILPDSGERSISTGIYS